MAKRSPDEEVRKKSIFDTMSARRQKHILKRGYDDWDPFQAPKDPIDLRRDKTQRTTQMLVRGFLQTRTGKEYSNEYGRGALEICLGIVNEDERSRGMFEFSLWYQALLEKEGSDA